MLLRAGERVALLGGQDLPPSASRASLERMAIELLPPERGTDKPAAAQALAAPCPARADRRFPLAPAGDRGGAAPLCRARGERAICCRSPIPPRRSLPFLGRVRFEGTEKPKASCC